jgi:HAMP domain-containing protein
VSELVAIVTEASQGIGRATAVRLATDFSGRRQVMNTRSLRFRLIAWYAGLLVVLCLAFGAYSYWRLEHYISKYWTEVLSNRAQGIANTLSANLERGDGAYVRKDIEARYAPESNDWFIRVTREDGSVVYISGEPNNRSFAPAKVPWSSKEFSGVHTRVRNEGSVRLLIASVPFVAGNGKYLVEAGVSALPKQRIQESFLVTLLIGLPVVLALAIWGGFWLFKWALTPVQKISSTVQEITLHHLNKRLPVVETGDEIASLSKTLNQMISRLEKSFQSVKRFTADASHELQTPLTILRESWKHCFWMKVYRKTFERRCSALSRKWMGYRKLCEAF